MTQFLKTCSKCRKQKWNSEFGEKKKAKDNLQSWCRDCINISDKRSPKIARRRKLRRLYNITEEDYELILKSQNGVCVICEQFESRKDRNGNIRPLSIDHNHLTNKNRGLLCDDCNNMLGRAKDNIKTLEAAIRYLKKYQ